MPPKPVDPGKSGLGTSRFALPANSANPYYGGLLDPRHRDPTAVVLEASTGNLEAKAVSRTYQTWHKVEDTDSKIIFHLDEINCLVHGFVKNKDGSQGSIGTATQATANLSIILDKILVFGKNQDFAVTDKGYFLEDDSVLRLNTEGEGIKGKSPALGVNISKPESQKPTKLNEHNSPRPATAIKLIGNALQDITMKDFASLPSPKSVTYDLEPKKTGSGYKPNSRCVLIAGLPYGFTVSELLNLITPTKNTLVLEVKLTKSYSGLIYFYFPEGARDFMAQFPNGYLGFPFEEPDLGTMEWRAKPQFWGDYEPITPESLVHQIEKHGATRFLRIRGRRPTTLKGGNPLWTLDDYRAAHNEFQIYDGHVYEDETSEQEIADLEFSSISFCVYAKAILCEKDGFSKAEFEYLPDPYVLNS
ncbi:hypothetical protein TWF694_007061 [Orbilia ellipsospora]|uniref:Mei2-like C-terminal RNA recognition motif domain-containing protein n=1 Tax=Orbilia ellipsospora TaxID=2528407 RepID=A0AAV9XNQ3_9PEZI